MSDTITLPRDVVQRLVAEAWSPAASVSEQAVADIRFAEAALDAPVGFGLRAESLEALRTAGLKPEEIAGPADVQHARARELVHWFARLAAGHANPKWAVAHAYELAYYVATEGTDRGLNLEEIKKAAYIQGANITPAERGALERIGFLKPQVPSPGQEGGS